MAYECEGIETIKLTVGVHNRTLDKIQYGITQQNDGEMLKPTVCRKTKKHPTRSEMLNAPKKRTAMFTL